MCTGINLIRFIRYLLVLQKENKLALGFNNCCLTKSYVVALSEGFFKSIL